MSDHPWVASSVDELLAGGSDRRPMAADDGKSGSTFERVTIDGRRYVVKSLSYDGDWLMRISGDRDLRTLRAWQAGVMHRAPDCIDSTLVGMAVEGSGAAARLTMLMHDVSAWLVPEGDTVVGEDQHLRFVDHLAALAVGFWGWRDDLGLTPLEHRFRFFALDNLAAELAAPVDERPVPIRVAEEGWSLMRERSPELHRSVMSIHAHPGPLAAALRRTPSTFVHGDTKMGNLGSHPDGRSILLDWAFPGEGPGCWDLAWYLSLNSARLPTSKEDTIAAYREGIERRGIATDGWFAAQIGLSLLGVAACVGWEKAVGDGDELGWWEAAGLAGARYLDAA